MAMRVRSAAAAGAIGAILVLGGCASTEPKPMQSYEGTSVPPGASLQSGEVAGRTAMIWRNPNADLRRYSRMIVDPVEIYRGSDANFDGASEQELRQLADYTRREFIRALGPYATTVPGPGVARIKLTLAGLENNVPVASTVSRVLPVGLAMNLAKTAMDQPGSFTGSATLAAQVVDAQNDAPLVTAVQKCYPSAMNIPATLTSRDAQEAGITAAAEGLRKRMDELQKRTS